MINNINIQRDMPIAGQTGLNKPTKYVKRFEGN